MQAVEFKLGQCFQIFYTVDPYIILLYNIVIMYLTNYTSERYSSIFSLMEAVLIKTFLHYLIGFKYIAKLCLTIIYALN